jgi:hypothetical protein
MNNQEIENMEISVGFLKCANEYELPLRDLSYLIPRKQENKLAQKLASQLTYSRRSNWPQK